MVAILSPAVLPEIRFTVDEYLQADLPEGLRCELVNGVIEIMPEAAPKHVDPVDVLREALYDYRRDHPGCFRRGTEHAAVPIPKRETVRQPDLALYREWESNADWSAWKRLTPFWVAEVVSEGQEKRDYEDKRQDYWRVGIEEYWIIDRAVHQVTVLKRGEKSWSKAVYAHGQRARSRALAGFEIAVDDLFRIDV